MNEDIQAANDALALMGVKLSPLAELYADLHKAYMVLLAEHAALNAAALDVIEAWDNGDPIRFAIKRLGEAMP